jgi:hypothetical protein
VMYAGESADFERCSTTNIVRFAVIFLTSSKPLRYGRSKGVSLDAPVKGFGLLRKVTQLSRVRSTVFWAPFLRPSPCTAVRP